MGNGTYLDIETGARILSGVEANGRNIADNALRIMTLDDKVENVKEEVRDISEIIKEMQEDVNTMLALNKQMSENLKEQRKSNNEIKVLLDEIILLQDNMREDIDKMKKLDSQIWGDRKVGVV